VVVVVLAVVVDATDVVASVDVAVDVELSVDAGAVSVAVDVLSVDPPPTITIPNAPEARIPAPNNAANARTIPTRRKLFRPFISPAPLLPPIRRMKLTPLTTARASPSRALPSSFARLSQARAGRL